MNRTLQNGTKLLATSMRTNTRHVRFNSSLGRKGVKAPACERNMNTAASTSMKTSADGEDDAIKWAGSTPILKDASVPKQPREMSDAELASVVVGGQMKLFNIENEINDKLRAVKVRRAAVETMSGKINSTKDLPYEHYDYEKIFGQCCENVIGHMPVPVGVAGPLVVDGQEYMVPMATTEGALVASVTRGCKALTLGGGVNTAITRDGMSRAPVLQCKNVKHAQEVVQFTRDSFDCIAEKFNSTSRFARLQKISCHPAGRKLFLRFTSVTGDAMGMNMVGKATEAALEVITEAFPDVDVVALSGNVCTDKKPSAINWIEGRGKSVSVDCVIPGEVVRTVLKTTVEAVCNLNYSKNLVGSAVAGSIGGNNAHAANIVAACFLATGQDPAQVVESSNCLSIMEPTNDGEDLYCSVTMPSIEVGTVGGGTSLPAQASMLELLGCRGVSSREDGQTNSAVLARIIASTTLAGELSLISALSSGHLISSHLKLNRKPAEPQKS